MDGKFRLSQIYSRMGVQMSGLLSQNLSDTKSTQISLPASPARKGFTDSQEVSSENLFSSDYNQVAR